VVLVLQSKNLFSKDGTRETYFADDNKYSLKDLIEKEKHIGVDDNNLMFSTIGPKVRMVVKFTGLSLDHSAVFFNS
jgi:hypothetical protein